VCIARGPSTHAPCWTILQAELDQCQAELEATRSELTREKTNLDELLDRERQSFTEMTAENAVLKSQNDVLKDEVAGLKLHQRRLGEAQNEHNILLEEDLSKEKGLAAELRESLYEAEQEAQATRMLALKRETQIEQLERRLSELKLQYAEMSHQVGSELREMQGGLHSVETVLRHAVEHAEQGKASAQLSMSASQARAGTLARLAHERQLMVLELQDAVEKAVHTAALQARDYERKIATLAAVIEELRGLHDSDLENISDLQQRHFDAERTGQQKDVIIQQLNAELRATQSSARAQQADTVRQAAEDRECILREANSKYEALEVRLQEREKELLKSHVTITGLGARVLQGEELLRQAEETAREAAAASKAEGMMAASIGAAAADEVLKAETRKVEALETKTEILSEQLGAALVAASEVPLLQHRAQRARELEDMLEGERQRAREREREDQESGAKMLADNHSLRALVVMLEEQAQRMDLDMRKATGKVQAMEHELAAEREASVAERAEAKSLLALHDILQTEFNAVVGFVDMSVKYLDEVEEKMAVLEMALQDALSHGLSLAEDRRYESEMRHRASKLAEIMSEMEVTMVQTEEALEQESDARLRADEALQELEGMYSNVVAENEELERRLRVSASALADEKAARSRVEQHAAAERTSLSEHINKDSQLQASQQVIDLTLSNASQIPTED